MMTITPLDVRKRVGDLLNRVALRGDEYLIERKGKPLAVLMSVEKAEAVRRAARLHVTSLLARPSTVATDREAMALANEARRAVRASKRRR